jgi:phosphoserine aminotransferase
MSRVPAGLPAMLDYAVHAKDGSMYNTPNCVGIYVLDRVLAWMEDNGGMSAMVERNRQKAATLYGELDRTGFWRPHADADSRSVMNVTWRLPSEELEEKFVKEARAATLDGLKGHRSVGGIRASLYNALGQESVDALVAFMADFERRNG